MTCFGRKQTGKKNKTVYYPRMSPEYYENSFRSFKSAMNVVLERFLLYSSCSFFDTVIQKRSGCYRIFSQPLRERSPPCTRPPNTFVRRGSSARNFTTKCSSRRNYNTTTTTRPRSMFGIVSSGVVFGPPSRHGPTRAIRRVRRGT